jgi:hypothetical protein
MANMVSTQSKTRVVKFGYSIDQNHIAWKSDIIKNDADFRRIMDDAFLDADRNKFNSIVVLMEISNNGGMGSLTGNTGTTFAELNLMAFPDSGGVNHPPTVKFRNVSLNVALPLIIPGTTVLGQQLSFSFDKASTSWNDSN